MLATICSNFDYKLYSNVSQRVKYFNFCFLRPRTNFSKKTNMYATNEAIMEKLEHMMMILSQMNKERFADQLLDENEFCSLLNITKKTAKAMRDNKEIEYAPLGRRIYYRTKDVEAMFDKAFRKPKPTKKKK